MRRLFSIVLLSTIYLSVSATTYRVTVPVGTKACYLAGEMNDWTFQQMNRIDETHYTLDVPAATVDHRYKYCSGPGWSFVENIDHDRSYSDNDVVTSWTHVYDPDAQPVDVTYTVTVPAGTPACYFVGAPSNWIHMAMARVDETHFRIVLNTLLTDGYKYCSGPDWAFEELDASGQTLADRNRNVQDVVARWRKVYFPNPVGVTYNVTVPTGTKACFLKGEMNGGSYIPMTRTDETHFEVNVPTAYAGLTYTYFSGPGPEFGETDAGGNSLPARTFHLSDEVANWKSIYTPSATVSLTSDFSGQSFECGSALPIRWTSSGVQNVRIEYTGDYGTTWTDIAASLPAAGGQFDWTLPAEARYQCKIRISDAADNRVTASTAGMFVVYHHLADRVDPLLSCYYQVFTYPYNARYPDTNPADNEIINGKVGNACGPTAVANILAYWEFPRKGFGSRTFTDVKNCVWTADFSAADYGYDLTSDQLTPASPQPDIDANATLMYHAGVAMHTIYRNGNSVAVLNAFRQYFGFNPDARELNRDDYTPQQWEKIMKSELSQGRPQIMQGWSRIFNDGNYEGHWYMCDGYNEDNLFHISLDYGENGGRGYCPLYGFTVYNMRNWIFAYLEPAKNGKDIELTHPSGSEKWKQGSVQTLTWNSTGVEQVKIEFSDNGGATWSTLVDRTDASAGRYDLTIPAAVSSRCKIRISDAGDINIYDRNKLAFSIYDTKALDLVSDFPDNLQSGVLYPIRWESKGLDTVSLEYSVNGGTDWTVIAEVDATRNHYLWTLPNIGTTACKVRVVEKPGRDLISESRSFGLVPFETPGGPYLSDDHTVALYHFDTDYNNLSNPVVTAAPTHTVSLAPTGIAGLDYGVRIDNTNPSVSSCVALPHDAALNLTGDWTLECWFTVHSWGGTTTANPWLLIKPGANYFIFLDVAAASLQVGYDYGSGAEILYMPGHIIEPNKWYHLAYLRNTANHTLKCELRDAGRQLLVSRSMSYAAAHIPKTTSDPIQLGGFGGGSNVQFDGSIDELRISNVVRNFSASGTGEIESGPDTFTVYPNPASGALNVYGLPDPAHESVLQLIDPRGRMIRSGRPDASGYCRFDVSAYPKGIYFIRYINGRHTQTRKIIVE